MCLLKVSSLLGPQFWGYSMLCSKTLSQKGKRKWVLFKEDANILTHCVSKNVVSLELYFNDCIWFQMSPLLNIQFLRILYILYVDRFVNFRNEIFQFLVKINWYNWINVTLDTSKNIYFSGSQLVGHNPFGGWTTVRYPTSHKPENKDLGQT